MSSFLNVNLNLPQTRFDWFKMTIELINDLDLIFLFHIVSLI